MTNNLNTSGYRTDWMWLFTILKCYVYTYIFDDGKSIAQTQHTKIPLLEAVVTNSHAKWLW